MLDAFATGGSSPPTTNTHTLTFFLILAHLIDRARHDLITDFLPLAGRMARDYMVKSAGPDAYPDAQAAAMAALTEITQTVDLDRHPGEITAYIKQRLEGAMRRWRTRELAGGVGRGRAKWSEVEPPPRKVASVIDADGEGLDVSTDRQHDTEDSLLHFIAADQALERLDPRDRDLLRHVQAGGTLTEWAAQQKPPVGKVRAGQLYERAVERLRGLYFG